MAEKMEFGVIGFGEHPFGSDEATARERREGRIGGFPAAVAAEGR